MISTTPTRRADVLNPRQKMHLESILAFIRWHGGRIYLNAENYAKLADEHPRLQAYQVDAAVDLGYAIGVIDIHSNGSAFITVKLLSGDIDAAVQQTMRSAALRGPR